MIRRLSSLDRQEDDYLHSPFRPEEVRSGDPVSAKIEDKGRAIPVRVWKYSPFGIEIIPNSDIEKRKVGDPCTIHLELGSEALTFSGVTVSKIYHLESQLVIGIRLFKESISTRSDVDRRASVRWACASEFLPTGTAPNPVHYNDFIIFRVENISYGGLKLRTSMRNKFIAVGQHLETAVSLPLVGNVNATLRIRHIDSDVVNGKEYLVLGVQIVNPDSILMHSLAEYLLNFGDEISVNSLREEGFPLGLVSKWFDFSYVKTEAEYREVLGLRLKAYLSCGKVSETTSLSDMADEFDARARILCVKYKGNIVGSVRIMFHKEGDVTHLESNGGHLPSDFPKMSDVVEASRMCTDPSVRGASIANQLLAHMLLVAVKSDRRYMFGGATGTMIDFYKRSGWKILNSKYKSKTLNGIEHHMVFIDTHGAALGKNISASNWTKLYGSLYAYMVEKELIRPTPVDELRLGFYRVLGNLTSFK